MQWHRNAATPCDLQSAAAKGCAARLLVLHFNSTKYANTAHSHDEDVIMIAGPDNLYKYRKFDNFLLPIITGSKVYYSDPKSFNDPLDCHPSIVADTDIRALENLAEVMSGGSVQRVKNQADVTIDGNELCYGHDPALYERLLRGEVERLLRKEFGGRGVLSLAARWDCPLMWSHYAGQHYGVCIEFRVGDPVVAIKAVNYGGKGSIRVSDIIKWKIDKSENARSAIEDVYFFSKALDWSYEKEWRSVRDLSGIDDAPFSISAIYFGMRCENSVRHCVVNCFGRSKDDVDFYEIVQNGGKLSLGRRLIPKDEIGEYERPRSSANLEFSKID